MFHPTYVWIFFNWYRDKFWMVDKPSCLMDKSAQPKDLERVLRTSLVMDQLPTVEDDEGDKLNVGNIVSCIMVHWWVDQRLLLSMVPHSGQ